MECCQNIPVLSCQIVDIEKRIQPITYTGGVLDIDAPVSVGNALIVGGAEISAATGQIDLPAKTLVNGAPLLSDAFSDLTLPTNTKISGYYPITEQYYYYYTAASGISFYAGYILNGQNTPVGSRTANSNQRCFSFIVPEECVLTSLRLLLTFQPGSYNVSSLASGFVDVMDTNLSVYYTGVYFEVPSTTTSTGRAFVETQFEYLVKKGDSVAVWVQSNISAFGSITAFATLGFKVIPPYSMTAAHFTTFTAPRLSSATNRFPSNGILSSIADRPTHITEQLERLKAGQPIHGSRPMTPQDYQARTKAERTYDDLDKILLFFFNNKKEGWFLDISSSPTFDNTLRLEQEHGWQGVRLSSTDDAGNITLNHDYDYLSIDRCLLPAFEAFAPVLATRTFGFVSVGHDGDGNIQSVAGNTLTYYEYTRVFTDVLVEKNANLVVREDWFAHPNLIDPTIVQRIREHPDNMESITSSQCLSIIRMLFDYKF